MAAAEIFSVEDLPLELRGKGLPLGVLEQAGSEGRLFAAICIPQSLPVGFALATLVDRSAHLHEMDVLPNHARRGLGGALVRAVVTWAEQLGFASVTLTTFRHLPWNAAFYERLGFQALREADLPVGLARLLEEEAEAGLERSNRLAMRLELSPDKIRA